MRCPAVRAWRPPLTPPADDSFAGVPEGELVGLLCAWDRVEAHAAARKLAAIAELGRRNPAPEDAEFTADEIANALGESRSRADELMGTADHLDSHLPGTRAALRDGTLSLGKARIIAIATGLLDPDEARGAENELPTPPRCSKWRDDTRHRRKAARILASGRLKVISAEGTASLLSASATLRTVGSSSRPFRGLRKPKTSPDKPGRQNPWRFM